MSVLECRQAEIYKHTHTQTHTHVYFLLDILCCQILTLTVFPKYGAADLFQLTGKLLQPKSRAPRKQGTLVWCG